MADVHGHTWLMLFSPFAIVYHSHAHSQTGRHPEVFDSSAKRAPVQHVQRLQLHHNFQYVAEPDTIPVMTVRRENCGMCHCVPPRHDVFVVRVRALVRPLESPSRSVVNKLL